MRLWDPTRKDSGLAKATLEPSVVARLTAERVLMRHADGQVRERWKSTRKKGDGPNGGEPRRVFEFRPDWKMKGLKAIAPEDKVKSSKLMKEQEEMSAGLGKGRLVASVLS